MGCSEHQNRGSVRVGNMHSEAVHVQKSCPFKNLEHRSTGLPYPKTIEHDCRQTMLSQSDYPGRMVSTSGDFRPDKAKVAHSSS